MKKIAFLAPAVLAVILNAMPAFAQEEDFAQDVTDAQEEGYVTDAASDHDAADAPDEADAQEAGDESIGGRRPSGSRFGGMNPFGGQSRTPFGQQGGYNPTGGSDPYGGGDYSGEGYGGEGYGPAPKKQVHILQLKTVEAEALADTLKQMFPKDIAVTAYPKSNRVVIYGTPEQIEEAEKLTARLDQKDEPQAEGGMDSRMNPNMATMMGGRADHVDFIADAPAVVANLKQQYAVAENRTIELAARYREESKRRKADDPRLQTLHKQLQESVTQAFQHRQDLHRAEIALLEQKIKMMKDLVSARDRIKSEIIDRRVADLENPARRWEEEQEKSPSRPMMGAPISGPGPAMLPGKMEFEIPTLIEEKPATIKAVNEKRQLVEISAGTDNLFLLDTKLQVWRDNKHLGEVNVVYAEKDRCVAEIRISKRDTTLQQGDWVGTALPRDVKPMYEKETSADEEGASEEQSGTELNDILNMWKERAAEVKSIEGSLHHFIYDNVFNVDERTVGEFYYEAPDKVAVVLAPKTIEEGEVSQKKDKTGKRYDLKPGRLTRWMQDGKVHWLQETESNWLKFDRFDESKPNTILSPAESFTLLFFSPQVIQDGRRYATRLISENDEEATIEFSPRDNSNVEHWHRAKIIFDKRLRLPKAAQLHYADADRNWESVLTFREFKINQPRPEKWLASHFGDVSSKVFGPKPNESEVERADSASIQLKLGGPESATILWTDSKERPSTAVILPGRITVPADGEAIFQLENLPGSPNLMLFGSFDNHAESPIAKTFVRHNAIPVEFTNEDIDQASSNNLVTKVFYLPKPMNDSPQIPKVEVLVSTRLDPGLDPIQEAEKRGDVLGILRLGNRGSDIGAHEDWHKKFLQNSLKAIEAERDQLKEDLLLLKDTLLGETNLSADARAKLTEELKMRKNQLANIERRRELYLKEISGESDDAGDEAEPLKPTLTEGESSSAGTR